MKQIKRKLHSNAGASVILALALVLVCVMVSSVIVAAAASGVARNEAELKNQKAYFAVTSAAQYIADNLNPTGTDRFCGAHIKHVQPCNRYKNYSKTTVQVGSETRNVYAIPTPYSTLQGDALTSDILQFFLYLNSAEEDIFCPVPGSVPNSEEWKVLEDGGVTAFSGIFKDILKAAATHVYKEKSEYSTVFTISVQLEDRIPKVKCTFKMNTDYQVDITVECNDGSSTYSMIVEMPAYSPTEDPSGYVTTEECKHIIFYEYCNSVGNVAYSPLVEWEPTFRHEVEHTTTTVTWGTPVIVKGN